MATHRHRYAPLVGPTTTTGWTAMVTMEITGKTVYKTGTAFKKHGKSRWKWEKKRK
jgi:hypothetical protein